jgi:uncharacterized membrane protein (UPF0136 family)
MVVGVYGIIVGTMGLYGYVKAKSVASVVAGEIGFALCAASAALLWIKKDWALYLALGTTGLLTLSFVMRFLKTRKFMPAGFLLVLSILADAVLVTRFFK